MHSELDNIRALIRRALDEDIGSGDATTRSIFSPDATVHGTLTVKASGIIAGLEICGWVFDVLDHACIFKRLIKDGTRVQAGEVVATIDGPASAILSGERTALNLLQRMSGIASLTGDFVDAVAGTGCSILDTRKTVPGLRQLDKMAVLFGGGKNHRMGLYDMVLIKDNHIDAAGSLTEAVNRVRKGPYADLPIEVECRTLKDVEEALPHAVDRLLLDNMDIGTIRKAVTLVDGRIALEVSGNVSLSNARGYAETGVSYISVGALTHSPPALDISLKLQ
jgi:nicotinate-nucleotide pyrophosphorylase (carboxylating)